MTKEKLIDYCRSRQSEVCISCKYFEECDMFIRMTGHTPYAAPDSEYTSEEVKIDGE